MSGNCFGNSLLDKELSVLAGKAGHPKVFKNQRVIYT